VADQARPVREPMSATTLLWLVTGCMMLQPLSTDLYLASLPGMALDFGVSPAAVQQTLSLFVFGFGTAQLISGPLSDRYGRRPVLIGGLALYLVSGLACALAPSLGWLIAARFVQAIGCCTAVVVARAIIRDAYSPAEGARVMARALSLLALAPILGAILGGYLQVAFGWRKEFFLGSFLKNTVCSPSSTIGSLPGPVPDVTFFLECIIDGGSVRIEFLEGH